MFNYLCKINELELEILHLELEFNKTKDDSLLVLINLKRILLESLKRNLNKLEITL